MTANEALIRQAVPEDAPAIWSLIRELAIYECAPEEHTNTSEQIYADMRHGRFHAYVAEVQNAESQTGKVVGMALFYPIYSTWKGHSFYLEDIVVQEKFRRQGIGGKLFEAVAKYAAEHNAGRLGWQVLDWNEPAIAFYKKYGAEMDETWITCKLRKEQLAKFSDQ